jgi:hypothetical protein
MFDYVRKIRFILKRAVLMKYFDGKAVSKTQKTTLEKLIL